ncbi:MAG: hypothetical protein KHX91_03775 [Clostridium sp.]|nr:hypothetical protein [Clostridium sp.]MEE0252192.1 hypothetical protein [Acutalibacteraceae bacterium]
MQQLSSDEKNFIFQIADSARYPIVRLELRSSKERSLISTALNHVRLETKHDSMEVVKQRASILQSLYEKGYIEICYKVFITVQSDYTIYSTSDIFLLLHQLVEEGKKNPDYLFDIPYIKRGQVMLTEKGRLYVEQCRLNR